MANIYERLGVRTIINAKGPSTRLSGGIMRPEVAEAMVEASQHCVEMAELQARASEIIAEITGRRGRPGHLRRSRRSPARHRRLRHRPRCRPHEPPARHPRHDE